MASGFIKKILLPKEKKFFPFFEGLADLITDSARVLLKIVESTEPAMQHDLFREIKNLEKKADDIAHAVFMQCSMPWIQPLLPRLTGKTSINSLPRWTMYWILLIPQASRSNYTSRKKCSRSLKRW